MEREADSLTFQENNNENENSYLGGVIRNLLRSISYLTRIESIGRLPLRIPTKIVARSADKLGQITDVMGKLQGAYEEIKERNITSKVKSFFHTSLKAYHGMVKSGLLGGILFSMYEEIVSHVHQRQCLSISNHSMDFNELVLTSSLASTSAGLISGGSHGLLHSLWDRSLFSMSTFLKLPAHIYEEISLHLQPTRPQFFSLGTCLSHSLVHGTLFGSYEFTKRMSLYLMNMNHESENLTMVEGGICVLLGGLAAGVISETVGTITAPLEEKGIREGIKDIVNLRPAQLTYSVRSIGPTILGFLAYEYTKEEFTASGTD
jgi:hypothetical protein